MRQKSFEVVNPEASFLLQLNIEMTMKTKKASILLFRRDLLAKVSLLEQEEIAYLKDRAEDGKDFCYIPVPEARFIVLWPKDADTMPQGELLEKIRVTASRILDKMRDEKIFKTTVVDHSWQSAEGVSAFMEGLYLGAYRFDTFKKEKKEKFSFNLESDTLDAKALGRIEDVCKEVNRSKYLIDLPFSALNAKQLGEWAEKDAEDLGIKVDVWPYAKIEKAGMGGLLGVNQGSVDKATFTEMRYKPAKAVNKKPIVLVGKGIVFDAGGMNIKTGSYMDDMKTDMAGAALAMGIIRAAARLRLPLYIVALLPATDNRLNGNALVCGDVITMYDGTTVEITNTDAEGRLLLADAVAYATAEYSPMLTVSMATLTGAASRALGSQGIAAMQQGADQYVDALLQSGERVHERLCFFPMWKEYDKELDSDVADIKNCGNGPAGMITAAKFVQYFAKETPFLHLDVAGVEFLHKKDAYRGPGATAFGIRMVLDFLQKLC